MAAKTIRSGITTASMVASIFFDLIEDALMSSLDDKRVTSRIAISAPPTPPLRTAVIDIALDVALVAADAAAITKLIIEVRQCKIFNLNLGNLEIVEVSHCYGLTSI